MIAAFATGLFLCAVGAAFTGGAVLLLIRFLETADAGSPSYRLVIICALFWSLGAACVWHGIALAVAESDQISANAYLGETKA